LLRIPTLHGSCEPLGSARGKEPASFPRLAVVSYLSYFRSSLFSFPLLSINIHPFGNNERNTL
jgi:hypothetical protein